MTPELKHITQELKKPATPGVASQLGQARTLVSAAARILDQTTAGRQHAASLDKICQTLKDQMESLAGGGSGLLTVH